MVFLQMINHIFNTLELTPSPPYILPQERLGKGGDHSQFVFEHVAPACSNLCHALGEDSAMFLPVVLPPVLAALEAEVNFSIEAAQPDEDNQVKK